MTSSEVKAETRSAKDSCQVVTTGKILQTTTAVQSTNQTIANKALTEAPYRRTFDEQKPFIFSIIGLAVAYIGVLIISQIAKNRMAARKTLKKGSND